MRRCETSEGQACFCTSRKQRPWLTLIVWHLRRNTRQEVRFPVVRVPTSIGSFQLRFATESAGLCDKHRREQPPPLNFLSPLQPTLLYSKNAVWGSILSQNFRQPCPKSVGTEVAAATAANCCPTKDVLSWRATLFAKEGGKKPPRPRPHPKELLRRIPARPRWSTIDRGVIDMKPSLYVEDEIW